MIVTKECMNGLWKKILKSFVHNFKGFAKDEELAKIKKAMVEMANNFNPGVDENDIEELLKVVLEDSTNEELLKLDQEHRAEEKAWEKETAGEDKEDTPPPRHRQKKVMVNV